MTKLEQLEHRKAADKRYRDNQKAKKLSAALQSAAMAEGPADLPVAEAEPEPEESRPADIEVQPAMVSSNQEPLTMPAIEHARKYQGNGRYVCGLCNFSTMEGVIVMNNHLEVSHGIIVPQAPAVSTNNQMSEPQEGAMKTKKGTAKAKLTVVKGKTAKAGREAAKAEQHPRNEWFVTNGEGKPKGPFASIKAAMVAVGSKNKSASKAAGADHYTVRVNDKLFHIMTEPAMKSFAAKKAAEKAEPKAEKSA